MEMLLLGFLLAGEAGWLIYLFSVVVSLVMVIPRVGRLRQPLGAWTVACFAFPLISAALANYLTD
ncbi:MAG: hypothetical protein ABL966_09780 [Acidimicrobiales bacterium]